MEDRQDSQKGRDKYSLRGRVYESIREDILSGRYQQNTELKEVAIGEERESAELRSGKRFGSWSWKGWSILFPTAELM